MNDIKYVSLITAELRKAFTNLSQYHDLIRQQIYFPEIDQFIIEYNEFQTCGYLDFIINLKFLKLFNQLEFYLKKTIELRKRLIELSVLPHSALPAFKSSNEQSSRRTSAKPKKSIDEKHVLTLSQLFLEQSVDFSVDQFHKLILIQKIVQKTNKVKFLNSELSVAETKTKTDKFVAFLKKDENFERDIFEKANRILKKRHFSVPQKLTAEKLQRICEKQKQKFDWTIKNETSNPKQRIIEYSLLMDFSKMLIKRQLEDQSEELNAKELKMIITKRKISMIYEDNKSIIENLKKEIRNLKRSNFKKWNQLKASLAN